jgi:hypothetical protein
MSVNTITKITPGIPEATHLGIPALSQATPAAPPMRTSAPPEERERAFVMALNQFGSVLLDVLSQLPPPPPKLQPDGRELMIVEADGMQPLQSRITELLKPGNPSVRMHDGERAVLRRLAQGFKDSLGRELPFSTGHWANFLEFVERNMPKLVQPGQPSQERGFSALAQEVRRVNRLDGNADVLSVEEMRQLSPHFRELLLPDPPQTPVLNGRYMGPDDWARFFLTLPGPDGDSPAAPVPEYTPKPFRVPVELRHQLGRADSPPAAPSISSSSLLDAVRGLN